MVVSTNKMMGFWEHLLLETLYQKQNVDRHKLCIKLTFIL